MKYFVPFVFPLLLLAAACGKVGEPHPPAIRIPARVTDLKVVQDQYQVILSWTNPSKYIDGGKATDLSDVHVLRDGKPIETIKVSGAGKVQTTPLPVTDAVGTTPKYSIEVETSRGKHSETSNGVPIAIVTVPGVISNLKGAKDQGRIRLEWSPPTLNASLAEVYIVRRAEDPTPHTVTETFFEDSGIETGKTYSYTVTAARAGTIPVPGPPSPPLLVTANDTTKPKTPTGLQPPLVSDTGAILQWDPNTEADLAGYWIYRSDNPATGFTRVNMMIQTSPRFLDESYRPGMYYRVSAEDADENESAPSASVRAP